MKGQTPWQRRIGGILLLVVLLLLGLGVLKVIYPLRYVDALDHWARLRSLDPYLVASVIRAESRFRPRACSPRGAIGLMQITPTTGEWIAAQVGEDGFTVENLYDPDLNIRFGTWYLRYLLERFEKIDLALAAYNAGPTNLARWQAGEGTIFSETASYIEKVKRGRTAYRTLYTLPGIGPLLRALPL
jgi:soluble lytic murein transglycosylase